MLNYGYQLQLILIACIIMFWSCGQEEHNFITNPKWVELEWEFSSKSEENKNKDSDWIIKHYPAKVINNHLYTLMNATTLLIFPFDIDNPFAKREKIKLLSYKNKKASLLIKDSQKLSDSQSISVKSFNRSTITNDNKKNDLKIAHFTANSNNDIYLIQLNKNSKHIQHLFTKYSSNGDQIFQKNIKFIQSTNNSFFKVLDIVCDESDDVFILFKEINSKKQSTEYGLLQYSATGQLKLSIDNIKSSILNWQSKHNDKQHNIEIDQLIIAPYTKSILILTNLYLESNPYNIDHKKLFSIPLDFHKNISLLRTFRGNNQFYDILGITPKHEIYLNMFSDNKEVYFRSYHLKIISLITGKYVKNKTIRVRKDLYDHWSWSQLDKNDQLIAFSKKHSNQLHIHLYSH